MVTEKVGKFKINVTKVGRKWLTISDYGKGQVEINDSTKDFEVGGEYEIYAKCITESNKFGTTKKYYPLSQEEYMALEEEQRQSEFLSLLKKYEDYDKRHSRTKEKLVSLADGDEELLSKLSEVEEMLEHKELVSDVGYLKRKVDDAKYFDSSNGYKIDYIISKIKHSNVYFKQHDIEKEFKSLMNFAFNICKDILENTKESTLKLELIKDVEDFFETELKDILDETISFCTKKCIEHLDEIENTINEGYKITFDVNSDKYYYALKQNDYLDENIKNRIDELNDKLQNVNSNKYDYLINNVFSIKDLESFRMTLNSYDIDDDNYIEETFNKYKFIDDKVYILNYRLSKDMFKDLIDEILFPIKLKVSIKSAFNRSIEIDRRRIETGEYYSRNPYLILRKLLDNGDIEFTEKKIDDENSDEKNIMLWSSEITKPFNYRKEEVYGEMYYFVTKKLYSPRMDDYYNAYYIVGWDSDTKRGFSHRLPWYENMYEGMTLKEILDDTFRFKEGYKRIQGDVIAKEYDYNINTEQIKHLTRTLVVNGIEHTDSSKNFISLERLEEIQKSETVFKRDDIRKNLYIEGEYVQLSNNVYKSAKVYCNGKLVGDFDTPVKFNRHEDGTKIKYDLYYEPAEYEISYKEDYEEKSTLEIIGYNSFSKYNLDIKTNNLGEHKLCGKIITEHMTNFYNFTPTQQICCVGPFSLTHGEHSSVTYGEEGKAYVLQLAKRHRKKGVVNID